MPLKLDMRKILRAEVVPWEVADAEGEEDLYGVAYMTTEGKEASRSAPRLRPRKLSKRSRTGRCCVRRVEAHRWLKRRHVKPSASW